jgi:hypothetical protein
MAVVEAARAWATELHEAIALRGEFLSEVLLYNAVVGFNALAALDTPSSPSLPESPSEC